MVAGVDPAMLTVFRRTGLVDVIGEENVIPRTPGFFEALDHAYDQGNAWVHHR